MCYSAQILADHKKYVRTYGADIDIQAFVDLFWARLEDDRVKILKAMEVAFKNAVDLGGNQICNFVDQFGANQRTKLEQTLYQQRTRLADAERTLLSKTTKAATEAKRIATHKVDWCMDKLADLGRTALVDQDARIFPGYYAPVMVMEDGKRVLKPMRYQCRPAGKPAFFDTRFPGTYNARRDTLEGFWKGQFGFTHGVIVVNAFYEHVERATPDGPQKVILEFKPRPRQDMLLACLWSKWSQPGEPDLLSFAAITDEPPDEIAWAGHDRCVIPIKAENLDAWLNPRSCSLAQLYAMLDHRERPYYENRLAA